MPLPDAEERSKATGNNRIYVEDSFDALQLMKRLQIEGFIECYARNPISGKYVKIEVFLGIEEAESGKKKAIGS